MMKESEMDQKQAEVFAAKVEAESFDETERPASRRMSPISMGGKAPARSLNDEARIKAISSKIIESFRERLHTGNEFDELNDRLRHATGHGSVELEQKAAESRQRVRAELLGAVYQVLDWLCGNEVKAVDTVMESKLKVAYQQGVEAGRADAERAYNAELSKLRDTSPLARSLSEKLK